MRTLDHDFPGDAEGVVIPHGLYDLKRNHGHVNLGTSRDTSCFACDSLAAWWRRHGAANYPRAASLLLLCDGGGSNSANRHVFKAGLQGLADRLGIEIRVAHYPPGCSKYNPIEHRLFPHVTRACQGVVFSSVGLVKELVQKAGTRTGLPLARAASNRASASAVGIGAMPMRRSRARSAPCRSSVMALLCSHQPQHSEVVGRPAAWRCAARASRKALAAA